MVTRMLLDVDAVRAHFPALRDGGAAHFDGPGGSQTPDAVADAVARTLTSPMANRGVITAAERNAERCVHECREALGDLLNVAPDTVIFGRSATSLTFELSRTLAATWRAGDEVVVSRLDHDANVRPWVIAAERAGATLRWADFDPATGEFDLDGLSDVITERTRLVAVTGASNLIGTVPDLAAIGARAHAAGALVYVDGVHHTAHLSVDVPALGADFFVCSPYKFLGPHCAALTGRAEVLAGLQPDKLLPATDNVPERFELGTLPYELMAGTTAAVDFLAGVVPGDGARRDRLVASLAAIEQHEDRLRERIEQALSELPGATVWSRARRRTPTLLVTFAGHDSADVVRELAAHNVNAPAGSFYAYEVSRRLGLGAAGGLRIGLAPYNDDRDVDRLIEALRRAVPA